MVYPSKAQTRYIAGLALVFGLIATTGYVVTQTNSTEHMKMSSVRTHDIALPAVSPSAADRTRAMQYGIGFIGAASGAPDAVSTEHSPDAFAFATALPGSGGVSSSAAVGGSRNFTGGNYLMARTHGAGGTGFAPGGFGMGGVGAWGGVSGHVPSGSGIAAAASAPRLAFRPASTTVKSTTTKRSSSAGAVAGASGSVAPTAESAPVTIVADASTGAGAGLAAGGGFSGGTGSTPGAPGSVPEVDGGGGSSSPGSSPAPNPEPMTLLLMGTGLVGLYKARHYLQ